MIELRLTSKCNFKCLFCHVPLLKIKDLNLKEILLIINSVDHNKNEDFVITGGEPTILNYLPFVICYIKSKNVNHNIELQTNGYFFSDLSYLNKLEKCSLDSVLLSFHSSDKDLFEKITGNKGSFEKVIAGVRNLAFSKIKTRISFVINQHNYKNIKDSFDFLYSIIKFESVIVANFFEENNYRSKNDYQVEISQIRTYLYEALEFLKEKIL